MDKFYLYTVIVLNQPQCNYSDSCSNEGWWLRGRNWTRKIFQYGRRGNCGAQRCSWSVFVFQSIQNMRWGWPSWCLGSGIVWYCDQGSECLTFRQSKWNPHLILQSRLFLPHHFHSLLFTLLLFSETLKFSLWRVCTEEEGGGWGWKSWGWGGGVVLECNLSFSPKHIFIQLHRG